MMAQLPYYRDVWALGPQMSIGTNCPGQFPRGFMSRVMKHWGRNKRDKLMLFSGAFHEKGWVTVDIRPETKPQITADCQSLPMLKDASFDLIVMDPPYSEKEAKELYDLSYPSMGKVLNEAARILRSGGVLCCLHRIVPNYWNGVSHEFRQLNVIAIVGVFTVSGMSNMRALTVWRKNEALKGLFSAVSQNTEEGDKLE